MKRFFALVLLFVLSLNSGMIVFATNDNKTEAEYYTLNKTDIDVDCNGALLMEAQTGEILFSHNENASASPASVTKIMTLLLVMEAIESGSVNLDDEVCVSAYAAGMGGSQVFLEEGERMSVEELIKCTVIASGNDSAVALAEHVAGSEDAFVRKMNEKAGKLGLKNTNFENVTGLDDTTENHVSSALDIAIMSRELLKHSVITKYSSLWQDSIRNGEFTLTNTNRLVRFYDGCNGLKTGSTDKAGFCISATAVRDGMQLIAVVMGAPTRDIRNGIAKKLLDHGFANYALYTEDGGEVEAVPVLSGKVDEIMLYSKPFSALVNKSDIKKISKLYDIPESIKAPVKSGDILGSITYTVDGKLLGACELASNENVEKITLFDLFGRMLGACVGLARKTDE